MPSSQAYCQDRIRNMDHDRYLCIALAPAKMRRSLFAVTAFSLELALVRETVSESLIGRMRLQFWRDAIAGLGQSALSLDQPVLVELAPLVNTDPSLAPDLLAMVEGREVDLLESPLADMAALEQYAAVTSGRLARIWARLAACQGGALEEAEWAGTAYGLVGLMRALPFNRNSAHGFLPADLVRRHGIDRWQRSSDALCNGVEEVVDRSRNILRSIRKARDDGFAPAWSLGVLAERDARTLRATGYDPFSVAAPTVRLGRQFGLLAAQWTRRIS